MKKKDLEQQYYDLFDHKEELLSLICKLSLDWELPEPEQTDEQTSVIDEVDNAFSKVEDKIKPINDQTLVELTEMLKKLETIYQELQEDQLEKTKSRDEWKKHYESERRKFL
jgi:hypothetical protein